MLLLLLLLLLLLPVGDHSHHIFSLPLSSSSTPLTPLPRQDQGAHVGYQGRRRPRGRERSDAGERATRAGGPHSGAERNG